MAMRKVRSKIWQYFKISEENSRYSECTICHVKISRGGEGKRAGTSAMKNHLRTKHKEKYAEIDFPVTTSTNTVSAKAEYSFEVPTNNTQVLKVIKPKTIKREPNTDPDKEFDVVPDSKFFSFERVDYPISSMDPLDLDDAKCSNEDSEEHIQLLMEDGRTPTQSSALKKFRPANKRSRKSNVAETLTVLKKNNKDTDDPYYSYALQLTHELRKYDQRTFSCVKHAINNILFEADMGHFGQTHYDQYSNKTTKGEAQSLDIEVENEIPLSQ